MTPGENAGMPHSTPTAPSLPTAGGPRQRLPGRAAIVLLALSLAVLTLLGLPFASGVNRALALTVFIGVLWLTEALPLAVTAVLVPVGALLLGVPGLSSLRLAAAFVDPVVLLFLGGFALAAALHIQQLDRMLALALLRLARGRFAVATLLLFAATALVSMGISNTATAALMLPLAQGMLASRGEPRPVATRAFVLLGVAYAASLGGMGTLVGSPPNAIAARAAGLDFADWLAIGLPLVLLMMPLMVLVLWLVLRPRLDYRFDGSDERLPWSRQRWLTLAVFLLAALGWVFGARPLSALGLRNPDTVVALAAAALLLLLRLLSWRQLLSQTDWGVLLLFGGGLALGEVLGASGASLALGRALAGLLQHAQPWQVLAAIAVFMVLLSEFASNTAATALLVPVFAAIAPELGVPVQSLIVLVALSASCGFALPVATPPNALAYGSRQFPQRLMLGAGLALDLVCVLVLLAWGLLTLA